MEVEDLYHHHHHHKIAPMQHSPPAIIGTGGSNGSKRHAADAPAITTFLSFITLREDPSSPNSFFASTIYLDFSLMAGLNVQLAFSSSHLRTMDAKKPDVQSYH